MTLPLSFSAHASALLTRVACGLSSIKLVYTPHNQWPLPKCSTTTKDILQVSVLDSSFNPPTLAHLALARAPAEPLHLSSLGNTPNDVGDEDTGGYDACLLLLSIRNVDKPLKPDDATHLQRLEMMFFFAQDVIQSLHLQFPNCGSIDELDSNIAIAIINEPLFIDKSTALLHFLSHQLSSFTSLSLHESTTKPAPNFHLSFLLGLDTLERLFLPRCYFGGIKEPMLNALWNFFDNDKSRFVCAWRDSSSYPSFNTPPQAQPVSDLSKDESTTEVADQDQGSHLIPPAAREFILTHQITMIDIGTEKQSISSSCVRSLRPGMEDGSSVWKGLVGLGIGRYIEENQLYLRPSMSNLTEAK